MARESREFFDRLKAGQEIGPLEAAKEGMRGFGSMMKEMGGKVWDGLTPVVEHGSHEMASALFRGDGFVMYPRNTKEAQHQEGQGMDVHAREERQMEPDR